MTLVDNRYGIHVAKGIKDPVGLIKERADIAFNDIRIYGESDSPDCPQNGVGGFCYSKEKVGYLSALSVEGGKAFHETLPPMIPLHKIMKEANWQAKVELKRMQFIDFKAKTKQGKK